MEEITSKEWTSEEYKEFKESLENACMAFVEAADILKDILEKIYNVFKVFLETINELYNKLYDQYKPVLKLTVEEERRKRFKPNNWLKLNGYSMRRKAKRRIIRSGWKE